MEKTILEKMYIEESKTIEEIASIYNCSRETIRQQLKNFKITDEKKQKIKDRNEKIKDLYLNGMSQSKIASRFGLSEKTVGYHLRKMKVPIRNLKKINEDEFLKLWNEGKTDIEMANYFGVSVLTISTYRTKNRNGQFSRLNPFSEKDLILTTEQEQFIYGSLLGDLALDLTGKMKNAKLCIVHSEKQKELFMEKVKILGNLMGSYKLYEQFDKRTQKVYKTFRGNSKSHKILTKLHSLLYKSGKKTITQEYLNQINHPIALAYWFMDDGTSRGTFATNCFSESEVDLLIDWLYDKWNIFCTKQKNLNNFVIHISKKYRLAFEKLIFPYVIPEMYYKLIYLDILKKSV